MEPLKPFLSIQLVICLPEPLLKVLSALWTTEIAGHSSIMAFIIKTFGQSPSIIRIIYLPERLKEVSIDPRIMVITGAKPTAV